MEKQKTITEKEFLKRYGRYIMGDDFNFTKEDYKEWLEERGHIVLWNKQSI